MIRLPSANGAFRLIVPGFLVALALLALAGATAYRQGLANVELVERVGQTHEVLDTLNTTLTGVYEIEASARGYALGGSAVSLAEMEQATADVQRRVERLRNLLEGDSAQLGRVSTLRRAIEQRVEVAGRMASARQQSGDATEAEAVSGEGRRLTQQVALLVAEMRAAEDGRLRSESLALRRSNRLVLGWFVALSTLLAGLLGAVTWLVWLQARAAGRELNLRARARDYAESIVDTVRDPLVVLDTELRVLSANQSFYETYRQSAAETVGRRLFELEPGAWEPPEPRDQLETFLRSPGSAEELVVRRHFAEIGTRTVCLNARRIGRPGEGSESILLAITDITAEEQAREALEEASSTIEDLYNHAPCGYHSLDRDGRFTRVNDTELAMLGYAREQMLGRHFLEFVAPGSHETFARNFDRFKTAGWIRDLEFELIRADGSPLFARLHATAVFDDEGQFAASRSVLLDETERRQTEDERDQLLMMSPDLFCVAGFDGYFKRLSPSWERLFGFTAQELMSVPFIEFVHPDDRERTLSETREQVLGRETLSFENRYRCSDGTYRWLSWSSTASTATRRMYAIAHDITERKSAEASLRDMHVDLKNRFETAVRASGQMLYCRDARADAITYDNSEAAFGYRSDELGTSLEQWVELVHPDDREAFVRELERAVHHASPFHHEYRVRHRDGPFVHVEDRGNHLLDEQGQVISTIGFVADVSERMRLEQQYRVAQKMEAVGRLAGGVAHDFNNLIGVVIGFADLLQDRLQGVPDALQDIQEIRRAGDSAAKLTRQLLAFSRRQVLEPRVLDLNALIAEVGRMLQRLLGEDIKLVVRTAPDIGRVKADPGQLEQVVMNLAVNARDAMPRGGVLTVETASADLDAGYAADHVSVAPGRYVMMAVSDTGLGMDGATQARVFEPFFTTKKGGTGLGLATVYGILKQSGGNIWVYSEPGRGTTFKVYLPRVDDPVEMRPVPDSDRTRPLTNDERLEGPLTVLLVEDSVSLRRLAREFLSRAGFRVLEARDGEDAVRLASDTTEPIHLLLTDVVMPDMSGPEVASAVKRYHIAVRTLYMSGYTDDAIVHHGLTQPGSALLSKPFAGDALVRKVREVLA